MGGKLYVIFFSLIVLCYSAKLKGSDNDERERTTSSTISVQIFNGKAFYNYIKLSGGKMASVSKKIREESSASSGRQDENEFVNFAEEDEDDAYDDSTEPSTTAKDDSVVISAGGEELADENSGNPSGNQAADFPSVPESTGKPADDDEAEAVPVAPDSPASPGEFGPTPHPGDAVPGQSSEDNPANASSESDSSEDDDSSSSSSSSEEEDEEAKIKANWEKAWQYKLQNALINRTGKSKNAPRILSPVLGGQNKFPKKEIKFSKRIS